ncbi:hypothetical protein Tco_1236754 [Tanacetum coccineum]
MPTPHITTIHYYHHLQGGALLGEVNYYGQELVELRSSMIIELICLYRCAQMRRYSLWKRRPMLPERLGLMQIGLSQALHHELQTTVTRLYAHETQIQAHQTSYSLAGYSYSDTTQLRKPGPDARIPDEHDAFGDADRVLETNVANTHKGNGENPKGNGCFECGAQGIFKRDSQSLKNMDGE